MLIEFLSSFSQLAGAAIALAAATVIALRMRKR